MLCSFAFPHSEMPAVIQWKPPWSSCPSQATRWICLCYRRWDWDMNTDLFFPWTAYASSFPLTLREWPDVEPLFDMEWDSCHLTLPSLSGFSSSRLLLQPLGRKTPISQELLCLSGTADGWLCVLTPQLILRQLRQGDTKSHRVPNRHLKDIFKENSLACTAGRHVNQRSANVPGHLYPSRALNTI